MSDAMQRHLFNLKFAAKEMARNSKKCAKLEKVEREKCKKDIRKGNLEGAKIHAEISIRQRNQSVNFLRMGSRLEGLAVKVENAINMNKVSKSMMGVAKAVDVAMKSMNLEMISNVMDNFDKQSEDLQVQSDVMELSLCQTTASQAQEDNVDRLLQEIAEEAGLELQLRLPQQNMDAIGLSVDASLEKEDLESRLTRLRHVE